jgi:hypothetical protein
LAWRDWLMLDQRCPARAEDRGFKMIREAIPLKDRGSGGA